METRGADCGMAPLVSRVSSGLHGSVLRSIRMTDHASGWFDRLREADCDGATQDATTTGALSGDGRGAPRIPRIPQIATDIRGGLRWVASVPIRAIRGQNQSGSNQALEPTETRVSVLEMAALICPMVSGLRGSAHRSPAVVLLTP
jgi:hypothetical protein